MQLTDLKPTHISKNKKRIARGGKKGTTSGRGTKGQKSRAGRRVRPAERDYIKSLPKLRGYKFKSTFQYAVVNVGDLEKKFNDGERITPAVLLKNKLIFRVGGRLPKVKILGDGDLKKKLEIDSCVVSASAKAKIEKAGGSIKVRSEKSIKSVK